MRSKYEFETPEDRLNQLEDLFARPRKDGEGTSARAEKVAAPANAATAEAQWQARTYVELERTAQGIHAAVEDILADYEKAKRTTLSPRVKKEFDPIIRIHYWKSPSMRGLFLRWSRDEEKPFLTCSFYQPLEKNDLHLAEVVQRVTGVRTEVQAVDPTREDEVGTVPLPFTGSFQAGPIASSKYGFTTRQQRWHEIAEYLSPPPASKSASAEAEVAAEPQAAEDLSAIYAALDETAAAIDEVLADLLVDFENAAGAALPVEIRRRYSEVTRVHSWRPVQLRQPSGLVRGLYLLWSWEINRPYLLLALAEPVDENGEQLGPLMEGETGVPVQVATLDSSEWVDWADPEMPVPPRPQPPRTSTRYGFETPEDARRRLREFLAPLAAERPAQPPRAAEPESDDETALQTAERLGRLADQIEPAVRGVLDEYEEARGMAAEGPVRRRMNERGHLHYWTSPSIEGLYLQWVESEGAPLLTLVAPSPLREGDRMLTAALAQATGLRSALVAAESRDRLGLPSAPNARSSGIFVGTRWW